MNKYREYRNFIPSKYINAKSWLINEYMKKSNINSCIIGVSGGIDSSITLALIHYASKYSDSPIKKITAILIPEFVDGTTGQLATITKAINLIDSLNKEDGCHIDYNIIDLTRTHKTIREYVNFKSIPKSWANGQLVSYIRTPILYYYASLLYQNGYPSIIVGTTNFDEIGYVGYFGKASDGMVDIQIISDIHKSEVYSLAKCLNIPCEIIKAKPSGDLYNGKTDEEFMGVTYNEIETYIGYLMGYTYLDVKKESIDIIENLNKQCKHKYHGNGYAIHLNLYDINIPGGIYKKAVEFNPDKTKFINEQIIYFKEINNKPIKQYEIELSNDKIKYFNNLLSNEEIKYLTQQFKTFIPVGNDGILKNYKHGDKIGSYRLSFYDNNLSNTLWNRIKTYLEPYYFYKKNSNTEFDNCLVYRPIGVSSLMRIIKYTKDGNLVQHYDRTFDFKNGQRTLMSFVIYLTTNTSGATRFMKDNQYMFPVNKRNLNDKDINYELNIDKIILPIKGSGIIFNHTLLHDSEKINNDEIKIILRTDIIFEQCLPYNINKTNPLNFKYELTDTYYNYALKFFSKQELKEASYTQYHRNVNISNNFLSTPTYKIINNINNLKHKYGEKILNKDLYVLINTGCYDPIHDGHIDLMEQAKIYLEKDKIILGGYLIPSHQSYINEKKGSSCEQYRLINCYNKIKDISWLHIDPFELLYEKADINYTQILTRIENYLKYHTKLNIKTIYVFGSDHAEFSRLFIKYGNCICIKRPLYEDKFYKFKKELSQSNIYWVDKYTKNLASRNITKPINTHVIPNGIYQLRKEYFNTIKNYDKLCDKIKNIFKLYLPKNKVVFVDVKEQIKIVNNFKKKTISLDPIIKGDYNISISRLFQFATPLSQTKLIKRPGEPSLEIQINNIKDGEYIIFDDDSVTGSTIKYANSLLGKNIKTKTKLLTDHTNRIDISDCRDFIIGAPYGGLVIQLPNNDICRVPYMLPYVFPSDRSLINCKDNINFSIDMWKMNYNYYLNNEKNINDIDYQTQKLLLYCGFELSHSMAYVCLWHINKFNI